MRVVLLLLAAALLAVQGADYRYSSRVSTPGHDIPCGQVDAGGKPVALCRLCGIEKLMVACDQRPGCKGFDTEPGKPDCGYLKGASGRGNTVYTEGYSHYCKLGAGSDCEGGYNVKRNSAIMGPGHDVECNRRGSKGKKLPNCQVLTRDGIVILTVADACTANPNCKAFDFAGFLKTATEPTTFMEGWPLYIKV